MKILYFYTPTSQSLETLLESSGMAFERINALEDIAKVDEYNICVAPTLIFLNKEGKEVKRLYKSLHKPLTLAEILAVSEFSEAV